jgi:hypothetical protein
MSHNVKLLYVGHQRNDKTICLCFTPHIGLEPDYKLISITVHQMKYWWLLVLGLWRQTVCLQATSVDLRHSRTVSQHKELCYYLPIWGLHTQGCKFIATQHQQKWLITAPYHEWPLHTYAISISKDGRAIFLSLPPSPLHFLLLTRVDNSFTCRIERRKNQRQGRKVVSLF